MDPTDLEMLDALVEAELALREMIAEVSIDQAVARCRSEAFRQAIPPGVHMLTGHEGKGQQFDWVFVVGVEHGTIPHYRARTEAAIAEEKRLLRVMASRARYGLAFTFVGGWFNQYGNWKVQTESEWLPVIEQVVTHDLVGLIAACEGEARRNGI